MKKFFLVACFASMFAGCDSAVVDNSTVKSVDLNRYLGYWYEIARFDHTFERGMEYAMAHYSLRDDGKIDVLNTGIKDGRAKDAKGIAKLTNVPGLLRVSFFGPFFSDYRIMLLDENYQYVLVGGSNSNYLWILSRTPELGATGTFQKSRDQRAGKDIVKMVKDVYQRNLDPNQTVAEVLIALSEDSDGFEFDISENTVTNLKRVQVGGLDIDPEKVAKILLSHVKKAKYRTISANAPQVQIEENKGALAFRKAIVEQTSCSFYNTLCDPDRKWELLQASHQHGHDIGVTQFPFDFQLHDARLHADWMFNLMQYVVKPKFRYEDQVVIDLSTIALVYKVYLSPSRSGRITFHYLVGSLGSGDPWTNILGTLGTRAVGRLLARMRPDIFYIDEKIGCNNGDDACYGVHKSAIELYGIDEIIRIANEIVTQVSYKFNESKLIKIVLPDYSTVAHWEQFAIWYNPISNQVCKHGSTCRYFGKVYGSEDLGRQTPLEGLIDQQSVINNTFGYVGNQTWMTTTFNIDVLREYCLKDDVLQSYLKKHGKAWFETVIDDAVKQAMDAIKKQRLNRADLVLLTSDMNDDASDEERYKHLAEKRVLHHLRAAGFDQSGLTKAMHDRDFSFLLTPKLVALGEAELSRIASIGKGRTLLISSIDGELTISAA